jgi:hypothetical protein
VPRQADVEQGGVHPLHGVQAAQGDVRRVAEHRDADAPQGGPGGVDPELGVVVESQAEGVSEGDAGLPLGRVLTDHLGRVLGAGQRHGADLGGEDVAQGRPRAGSGVRTVPWFGTHGVTS